ncbi:hypothetical protein [Streptomyces anthocyanicus]|uniref:hypothetical protein n=1 Tax=Streptomyces anthocyanicus TaxID=68174 RepID=UPI0037AA8B74
MAAARALDPAHPKYAEVVYDALDGCQRALYTLGRRDEGLAVRAEMLAVGRTRAESSGDGEVWGLSPWAIGLLEEGRYAEAADVLSESVARGRRRGPREGELAWTFLQWTAALDGAGRTDEALTAMAELAAMEAAEAENGGGPRACRLYVLIRYAQMLDDGLRHADATAVRSGGGEKVERIPGLVLGRPVLHVRRRQRATGGRTTPPARRHRRPPLVARRQGAVLRDP